MEQKIFNYFKKCVLKIANIKYPEKRNKYGKECVAINGEYKEKRYINIFNLRSKLFAIIKPLYSN